MIKSDQWKIVAKIAYERGANAPDLATIVNSFLCGDVTQAGNSIKGTLIKCSTKECKHLLDFQGIGAKVVPILVLI